MQVIEKIGTDRALDLLYKAVDSQADIIQKEFSQTVLAKPSPLEKGLEVYTRFMRELGAHVLAVPIGDSEFSLKVERCPIYEAYLSIGLECDVWMHGLCTNIVLPSILKIIERFEPDVRLDLVRYRASLDEPCLLRLGLQKSRLV